MATIVGICGLVLAGFAVCLLAPFAVAILNQNIALIEGLGLFALGYALVAALVVLALRSRISRMDRGQMFTMVCFVWATMVAAATLPIFVIENNGFVPALFDAASASTSLGNTFFDPQSISTPMKAYRAVVAWYGGLLTLTLIVYVMSPFRVGGIPNRDLRFVLHGSAFGDARLYKTLSEIVTPYAILTLTCLLLLLAVGARPLDAFLASTAALSTNGFVPTLSGGSIFNSVSAELIFLVFMIIGGTSIIWHKMIVTRRFQLAWQEHKESVSAIGLVLAIAVGLYIYNASFSQNEIGFLRFVFDVAATMTTSGVVHNASLGSSVPLLFAMMLAIGGATTFSTSGGIKLFRLGVMISHSLTEARHLILPNAILPGRLGSQARQSATIKAVWGHFFLFIITVCVGLMGFSLIGVEFQSAFASSVGSLSSVASLVDSSAFAESHGEAYALWVTCLALVGRIEFLVILAAISHFQQR